MKALKVISRNAISNVRSSMVLGTSNQAEDIIRTSGWSATADAVNLDLLSDELSLYSLYSAGPLGEGGLAARDAAAALLAKAGNCGYMTALALKFIAEDPLFRGGIIAKRKYFCEPFQHTFLEISDGKNVIYCDPWLGQTFVSISEIASNLLKIEEGNTARLQCVLDTSQFSYFTPFDLVDDECLDETILEELEHNFTAYCYQNSDWARTRAKESLEQQKEKLQSLIAFSNSVTCDSQYLQTDGFASSYYFILSAENKGLFLDLFKFYYLLELKILYPRNLSLHAQIHEMFKRTQYLQADDEYAKKALKNFSEWLEKNSPNELEQPALIFSKLVTKLKTPVIQENPGYCGFKPGFINVIGKLGL